MVFHGISYSPPSFPSPAPPRSNFYHGIFSGFKPTGDVSEGLDSLKYEREYYHIHATIEKGGIISGIGYKKGLQPMIMPSLDMNFRVKMPNLKATLTIAGDEIILSTRKLSALIREYESRVTGISVLGNGITRQYVPRIGELRGSMVANIALSGILGPAAGVWVLSHIIHGDLSVSPDSLACYAEFLSVESGKLKLSAPIVPEILSCIHTVTDGDNIYSVWHSNLIMRLELNGHEWKTRSVNSSLDYERLRSCVIIPCRRSGASGSSSRRPFLSCCCK